MHVMMKNTGGETSKGHVAIDPGKDEMVHNQFMILANCVDGLTDAALLDCFISGLHDPIRREVIAQSPQSLLRVVSLARLYDEKGTIAGKPVQVLLDGGSSDSFIQPRLARRLQLPIEPASRVRGYDGQRPLSL
ncbi:Aspartic peptidase domain superfamily [Sesbania bispinosa]|nr:Aspartic peptidase domain superfamily [Sesbania bispinosa]